MAHSKVRQQIYDILDAAGKEAVSARQSARDAGRTEDQAQIEGLQVLISELGQALYVVADALGTLLPDAPPVRPVQVPVFGGRFGLRGGG